MDDIDLSHMTVEVEMVIAASPEVVWDLVTSIEKTAEWSPETYAAQWVDQPGGPVTGAVFRGHNRRKEFEWSVDCYVLAAERPRAFAWAVVDPEEPSSIWRYDLEKTAADTTTVRHRFQHGPGFSGVRWAISRHPDRVDDIIARRSEELRRNMLATLGKMKEAAEAV